MVLTVVAVTSIIDRIDRLSNSILNPTRGDRMRHLTTEISIGGPITNVCTRRQTEIRPNITNNSNNSNRSSGK